MEKKLAWNKSATKRLTKELKRISEEDSIRQAEGVEDAILSCINKVLKNPERYPPDKYKIKNEGNNHRAFETHSFRVSYRITGKEVRILRIRHVKQCPKKY